jgi:type I restriction enzyme S subunit
MRNQENDLPELPRGWVWTRLGEIADVISGYGFPEKYQGSQQGIIPFFKVADISRAVLSGSIYLRRADNYVSPDVCKELRARPLPAGTIVFAKIGEAIKLNRRAILTADSLVDNNVMGVYGAHEEIDYHYLFYFLQTIGLWFAHF